VTVDPHRDNRAPGTVAYRCRVCAGPPTWRLDRHGDAVVDWSCDDHLQLAAEDLKRPFERSVFTLTVTRSDEHDGPIGSRAATWEVQQIASLRLLAAELARNLLTATDIIEALDTQPTLQHLFSPRRRAAGRKGRKAAIGLMRIAARSVLDRQEATS
jgi:hypothetical protein